MQRETFRAAVLAAVLAFQAQHRVVPHVVRRAGRRIGRSAMLWLDRRRDRHDHADSIG